MYCSRSLLDLVSFSIVRTWLKIASAIESELIEGDASASTIACFISSFARVFSPLTSSTSLDKCGIMPRDKTHYLAPDQNDRSKLRLTLRQAREIIVEVTRIGAYGILMDENRVLLCRLSSQVPGFAGNWTLPGGGIEFGEQPADAMVREVEEETGLHVIPKVIVDAHSLQREFGGRNMHSIRIVYLADVAGGELRFEQDGTTDRCEWFTEEEARTLPLVELGKEGIELAFGSSSGSEA